jgi:hypothetical protein
VAAFSHRQPAGRVLCRVHCLVHNHGLPCASRNFDEVGLLNVLFLRRPEQRGSIPAEESCGKGATPVGRSRLVVLDVLLHLLRPSLPEPLAWNGGSYITGLDTDAAAGFGTAGSRGIRPAITWTTTGTATVRPTSCCRQPISGCFPEGRTGRCSPRDSSTARCIMVTLSL